jgi:hypothetical protein
MSELKHRGYSGSDIVLGMISTLKAEICKDYQEKIKLTMLKFICDASYRISKGTDSILQLYSCLTDIVSV